ncbi:hypothetical protein KY5_0174 [Streptomyces formicae]|uniref:Uncharacterized protein n=1 Tax=Streptomyces formicae TaxID=1616117 RepID=A0A291Q0T3_9ACTN|nr:hypothetical protein KY5_0174 [Streptomyces formicae]
MGSTVRGAEPRAGFRVRLLFLFLFAQLITGRNQRLFSGLPYC